MTSRSVEEGPRDARLVALDDPGAPAAEAYRALASSLRFGAATQAARSLLLVSWGRRDGNSTTVANLAVAAAQSGAKVVAVDCNLHDPALHRLFGLANTEGVSTALATEHLKSMPLQAGGTPGLQVLVAGPPPSSPSQLLGSARFDQLLVALREQADMVLLDSPAMEGVADAALMAPRVDGVLLLIRSGRTRREAALRARDQLARLQAHVVGVVLNNARTPRG